MSTPKTVLMLIPQLTYGGAERVFHDHARELAAAGYRVIECVFDSSGRVDFPTQNEFIGLDVPGADSSLLSKAQTLYRRVARLRSIKREYQVDVCISHLEGADYINLLSRGTERILLCIHNSKKHDKLLQVGAMGIIRRRLLMPWLYRRADRVVPVSRALGQEIIDYTGVPAHKVVAITNLIEQPVVVQRAAEPLTPAEEDVFAHGPVLATTGRLVAEKNLAGLLTVLAGLRAAGQTTVRLLLLGDGPLRAELVGQATAMGLRVWECAPNSRNAAPPPDSSAYDVILLGFQANPFRFVSRATIAVLSSTTEGFPLALCEAMACGVPVASADCPTGPREILAPSTPLQQYAAAPEWAEFGLLLPLLGTTEAERAATAPPWVSALTELLAHPARRAEYATQASRRAADFGTGPVMAQWRALIDAPVLQ